MARLRVHGEVVPDPRFVERSAVDLAALENGGTVVGCSNLFYGSPDQLIAPGLAAHDGRGLGDRPPPRRRQRLGDGAAGGPRLGPGGRAGHDVLPGQRAGWAALSAYDGADDPAEACGVDDAAARGPALQPDTRHRFVLPTAAAPATHVRLDVYPDGGMARLRLWGTPTDDGLVALRDRWDTTA